MLDVCSSEVVSSYLLSPDSFFFPALSLGQGSFEGEFRHGRVLLVGRRRALSLVCSACYDADFLLGSILCEPRCGPAYSHSCFDLVARVDRSQRRFLAATTAGPCFSRSIYLKRAHPPWLPLWKFCKLLLSCFLPSEKKKVGFQP